MKEMNKKKKNLNKVSKKYFKYFISFGLIIFFVLILWPVKNLLFSNLLFSKSIVIISNESEQRPCGGFFTAIGESKNFPFDLEFKNIYDLVNIDNNRFVPEKLKPVTNVYNFWDSGINSNVEICQSVIKNWYQEISDQTVENVFLVNYKTIESILSVVGSVKIDKKEITDKNVFRFLSESAANVDRHNKQALKSRKNVLKPFISAVIRKTIIQPWKWISFFRKISEVVDNGDLYISGISKKIEPNNGFGLVEWNLGGAKTSRFLQKDLDIFIREIQPGFWRAEVMITLKNTLGVSEPFGQTWKGGIDVLIPDFIENDVYWENLEIKSGESLQKKIVFEFNKKDLSEFSVFSTRGQDLNFNGIVSTYPQQEILESNGEILDFTTRWRKNIRNGSENFHWKNASDLQKPFITFHERVLYENLSKKLQEKFLPTDFLIEIHTNENIKIKNLTARLQDLGNNSILENRVMRQYEKISDNAILLAFNKKTEQIEEAFDIRINGIFDNWENELEKKSYTVIER